MVHFRSIALALAGTIIGGFLVRVLNNDTDGKFADWEQRLAAWRDGKPTRTGPAGG